nr:hypothetical protein [Verrucomicrobium spinosum]
MAALGCCLVGMPDGSASKHVTGIPQTDSVCALLEDELQRTTKGVPSPRASFLSRFAKLVQKYELVQPKPTVPHAELSGVEPAQGAAREMPRAATPLPARKGGSPSPPPPMPQHQRPVEDAEQPALGFAEALIQKSSVGEVDDDFDEEFALPPMRSGMRVRSSTVESSWMSVRSKRPFWLTCTMVVAGALLVGAALAHFTGRAVWLQGNKEKTSAPTPKGPEKDEAVTKIELPVPPDSGKSTKLSLPPPSKPVVKDLEALAKRSGTSAPGSGAGAAPAGAAVAKSTPPVEVAMAIPLASDPSLISKLQDLRKTGGKLTKELRGSAERAAQAGSSEAMLAMGRAYLRGRVVLWMRGAASCGLKKRVLPEIWRLTFPWLSATCKAGARRRMAQRRPVCWRRPPQVVMSWQRTSSGCVMPGASVWRGMMQGPSSSAQTRTAQGWRVPAETLGRCICAARVRPQMRSAPCNSLRKGLAVAMLKA